MKTLKTENFQRKAQQHEIKIATKAVNWMNGKSKTIKEEESNKSKKNRREKKIVNKFKKIVK